MLNIGRWQMCVYYLTMKTLANVKAKYEKIQKRVMVEVLK